MLHVNLLLHYIAIFIETYKNMYLFHVCIIIHPMYTYTYAKNKDVYLYIYIEKKPIWLLWQYISYQKWLCNKVTMYVCMNVTISLYITCNKCYNSSVKEVESKDTRRYIVHRIKYKKGRYIE